MKAYELQQSLAKQDSSGSGVGERHCSTSKFFERQRPRRLELLKRLVEAHCIWTPVATRESHATSPILLSALATHIIATIRRPASAPPASVVVECILLSKENLGFQRRS